MWPRKYDLLTLRLAAELFQLGLSYQEIGKIFGYDFNLLRSAVVNAFPDLGRKTPGRPDSRLREMVRANIQTRLSTIEFEIEAANDEGGEVLLRLKPIMVKWLETEQTKPPKLRRAYAPRCLRLAVVRRLYALGLEGRAISWLTGYVVGTVNKDITHLRFDPGFSKASIEASEVYRAVLIEYADIRFHQGFVEEAIEDTKWYLGLLEKYLRLPEIMAYLLGVEENLREFERIEVTPEDESYIRLWQALASSNFVPPTSRLRAERVVENVWHGFVSSVERDEASAPTSARKAARIIAAQMRAGRRGNFWPVWREEWSHALDKAMTVLEGNERYVLNPCFGFGQSPSSFRLIGQQLGVTGSRVQQIEKRALKSLRRTDEFHHLCRLIVPAKLVAETIQKLMSELAEAQATIRQLRVEVFEVPDGRRFFGSVYKPVDEVLFKTTDELELSVRLANCLQNMGIEFIWQLVQKTEAEMLKTKNFGRKSLREIKEVLFEIGLSLGMKLPEGDFPWNKQVAAF